MWYQWLTPAPTMIIERPWVFGVFRELAGNANDVVTRHAGDLLGPGRAVGLDLVIVGGAVGVAQPALEAVVGKLQVVHAGHQRFAAVRQLQAFHRQLVQQDLVQRHAVEMLAVGAAEVREAHLGNVVMHAQQAELQLDFLLRLALALFQVPLALLAPAEADGACGATRSPLRLSIATVFHSGLFSWPSPSTRSAARSRRPAA